MINCESSLLSHYTPVKPKPILNTLKMTTSLHQFGFFDVFDTRALSDADWELSDFDPKLTGDEFAPDADVMSRAQLSIAQEGKLQLDFYDKLDNPQLKIDTIQLGWTDIELVK